MSYGEVRRDVGELVTAAANGDGVAFSELVRMHQGEVYTLAYRLTGDPHTAADVAQNAFVRAWRGVGKFRGDAQFSTWLHRITVNAAWTEKSKKARRHADSLDDLVTEPASDAVAPDVLATDAALSPTLAAAMADLSPGLRTVVVLKDIYQWSHTEIADHLDISVTAAKVRLHRARRILRERFVREGVA